MRQALFRGTLVVISCFRRKLHISFPATGCQTFTEVDNDGKPHTFVRSVWPQKLLLTLWVKSRREYVYKISSGNSKQVFLMNQGILTRAMSACSWAGPFLQQTKEDSGKEVLICSGFITDANLCVLTLVNFFFLRRKIFLDCLTTVPCRLRPERASGVCKFSISLNKMMSTSLLWESPWTKTVRNSGPKC